MSRVARGMEIEENAMIKATSKYRDMPVCPVNHIFVIFTLEACRKHSAHMANVFPRKDQSHDLGLEQLRSLANGRW